uniref:Transmembrane protein n=1 Tax=Ralstonia solanacearum TaxID=305 RepID=A0A0S4TXF0_RALSL|nr:protein of unknown function [Ralstonia solanacearum]
MTAAETFKLALFTVEVVGLLVAMWRFG